jgi:hypothetical protein
MHIRKSTLGQGSLEFPQTSRLTRNSLQRKALTHVVFIIISLRTNQVNLCIAADLPAPTLNKFCVLPTMELRSKFVDHPTLQLRTSFCNMIGGGRPPKKGNINPSGKRKEKSEGIFVKLIILI